MFLKRRLAGVLLHPTSFPGRYGIGDLGPEAHRFVEWMHQAGLGYWQVLPLGPTSYGDSPYQCFSAFAGNPLLVSPELLVREGLLTDSDIHPLHTHAQGIDYGAVIPWKRTLLGHAQARFNAAPFPGVRRRYEEFKARDDVRQWLDNFALFMACKDAHAGEPWNTWEPDLRSFKPEAVEWARERHAADIEFHRFAQFLFFDQWDALRAACHAKAIQVIGDAPIYVAYDSADTWTNQELFELDKAGLPKNVAGVPPDYFSRTGQLWGNPLYNWTRMAKSKYDWWIARMRSVLAQVDVVRLDHFRGFCGYYAVPFGHPTAEHGEWVKGPGTKFIKALEEALGDLPIIAEDLGDITRDVVELREQFHLAGMKIMQFAFSPLATEPVIISDPNNLFALHQHEKNMVVYTGTHDNDTTIGWWRNSSTPAERTAMQVYFSTDGNLANWDLIRAAFMSVANTTIIPAQDFLGLGSEARMNLPGRPEGNWTWRLKEGHLSPELAARVRAATLLYDRCANPPEIVKILEPKAPSY